MSNPYIDINVTILESLKKQVAGLEKDNCILKQSDNSLSSWINKCYKLEKENAELRWDEALNNAIDEIIDLKEQIKQLQTCKQFKGSYNSKLLDENIALKAQIKDMNNGY